MADIKYPKAEGLCHVWVFDHTSCHAAMADDTLDVDAIYVKPGGRQQTMRDTIWRWHMYTYSCKTTENGFGRTWGVNSRKTS